MTLPNIIGLLSPAAGCGKSTVAGILIEAGGHRIEPFAGTLKRMLVSMLQDAGLIQSEALRLVWLDKHEPIGCLPGAINTRRLQQTLGTEWGRDLIGFDESQVELNGGWQLRIADQDGEGLADLNLSHPQRSQFFSKANGFRPLVKCLFNAAIGFRIFGQHLQTRTSADHVVRQRQYDAAGVTVVGDLIASSVAKDAAHLRTVCRVGRQAIRIGPVPSVVVRGQSRVVLCPDKPCGSKSGTCRERRQECATQP